MNFDSGAARFRGQSGRRARRAGALISKQIRQPNTLNSGAKPSSTLADPFRHRQPANLHELEAFTFVRAARSSRRRRASLRRIRPRAVRETPCLVDAVLLSRPWASLDDLTRARPSRDGDATRTRRGKGCMRSFEVRRREVRRGAHDATAKRARRAQGMRYRLAVCGANHGSRVTSAAPARCVLPSPSRAGLQPRAPSLLERARCVCAGRRWIRRRRDLPVGGRAAMLASAGVDEAASARGRRGRHGRGVGLHKWTLTPPTRRSSRDGSAFARSSMRRPVSAPGNHWLDAGSLRARVDRARARCTPESLEELGAHAAQPVCRCLRALNRYETNLFTARRCGGIFVLVLTITSAARGSVPHEHRRGHSAAALREPDRWSAMVHFADSNRRG